MTPDELQERLEAATGADKVTAAEAVARAFEAEYAALMDRWPSVELDFGCGCCSSGHHVGGVYVSMAV